MTCKDCLLRPMCFAVREIGEKDICAEHCPKFKNKADFVEVVRCKDCKNKNKAACPLYIIDRELCGIVCRDDCYCSYGERE